MSQCCKTCKWLVVEPNAAGRRVVSKSRSYPCVAPMPELPPMPVSVTKAFDFEMPGRRRHRVWGDEGATCPVWAKYVKSEGGAS